MLKGKAVYDEEMMQVMTWLGARGLLLVVIGGKKGQDVEFGAAVTQDDLVRLITILDAISAEFKADLASITNPSAPPKVH